VLAVFDLLCQACSHLVRTLRAPLLEKVFLAALVSSPRVVELRGTLARAFSVRIYARRWLVLAGLVVVS
jgi:hypothetical protein